jgi:hypothetical protein
VLPELPGDQFADTGTPNDADDMLFDDSGPILDIGLSTTYTPSASSQPGQPSLPSDIAPTSARMPASPLAPASAIVPTSALAPASAIAPGFEMISGRTRAFFLESWKASAGPQPCQHSGLRELTPGVKNLVAGLRVGSLATKLIVDGASLDSFEGWLHMLDSHFPGEFGQVNHSKRFAAKFSESLLGVVEHCHMSDLQSSLKALRVPSDYARVIDGLTTSGGETLLIHVVLAASRDGVVRWHLLDLTPIGTWRKHSTRVSLGRRSVRFMRI